MIKKISFLTAVLLFAISFGQKKEQLQKQNAELKKQIAAINAQLSKTRNESKLSVAYLEGVNKKIQLREKVYNNTQKEKRFIEDDIYLRQLEINRQNRELAVLRKNYAKVLIHAYKNRDTKNKVTFVLSSKSLGEAIRRVQYLKKYTEYQERKAAEISNAAQVLKKSITEREKSKNQKNILLANQQKELLTIEAERIQKEKLVQEFKKNEVKLTAELRQKQAQSKLLDGKIRSIIAEELRLAKANEEATKKAEAEKLKIAREVAAKEKAKIDAENKAKADALAEAKRKADAEAKKAAELAAKKTEEQRKAVEANKAAEKIAAAEKERLEAAEKSRLANEKLAQAKAAEDALAKKTADAKKAVETKTMTNFGVTENAANNFASKKGSMSMPAYGTITHRFGKQPHPVFEKIMEENNGIKISVTKGTAAKCVFPGTVSNVIASGDGLRTVIIKHGNYFTIYSNLATTSVSKNQQVSAGTPVGVVGEDYDGTYTLEFQIWNGNTPVDPMLWVN